MDRLTFRVDYSKVLQNFLTAQKKADTAIRMFATQGAKKFENYAKKNRPWTDRTGKARQTLSGWVETNSNKVRIYVGHGVYYGVYLEFCHERRFAILQPTVHALSPEILKAYKDLLRYIQ